MNDLLLDQNFDLQITESGDLAVGDSDRQHQELLLILVPGELREWPTRGVGIHEWLLEERVGSLNSTVKRQYELDGMQITNLRNRGGALQIDATYE